MVEATREDEHRDPGWYPDPEDQYGRERYWDGQRWARRGKWPEKRSLKQRLWRRYGREGPEWYMRAPFAIAYLGLALLLSIMTVWWVGLALIGLLVLLYLILAYAPWMFFFDGG